MFRQKSWGKLLIWLILTLKEIDVLSKSFGSSGIESSSKSSFPSSLQGTRLINRHPMIELFRATIGIYLGLSIE